MSWIYDINEKNSCRYSLGRRLGPGKTLICFGINPSTASPNSLDNTVRRVENFARDRGYGAYIMLNIYPQRSTDPRGIHKRINKTIHQENLKHIEEIFKKYPGDLWAAWGNLIETRKYFKACLKDIYKLALARDLNWLHFGELTKAGHPRHPLYLKKDVPIYDFEIEAYI